jgi:hypothetical protein
MARLRAVSHDFGLGITNRLIRVRRTPDTEIRLNMTLKLDLK